MQPPPRIGRPSPTSLLAYLLLAAICTALALTPLRSSHDEWWHLKTGKWIEENGLPENDIFTFTAENIRWHNHEWLADLGLWKIFKRGELSGVGGVRAVIYFKAAFLLATYLGLALFLSRMTGAPAVAALAAAVACALARRTLYPRPPFISYGFMALVLCCMIAWRRGRLRTPWLFALVPLFALWANLHGGFMAGLVVLGAFWAEAGVAWALAAWRLEETGGPRRAFGRFTAVCALCGLATLATPSGIHLYAIFGRVMGEEILTRIVAELQPANWRFVWILDFALIAMLFAAVRPRDRTGLAWTTAAAALLFYLLQGHVWLTTDVGEVELGGAATRWDFALRYGGALALFFVAAARSKQNVGLALTLLILFFAHQAIFHVRHLPLLGIVLAPVMAATLVDWAKGTVGGWDWLMRIQDPALASADAQENLRAGRTKLADRVALVLLAAMAGVYLVLPEEAVGVVAGAKAGVPIAQAGGRRLTERNLAFLRDRGGDRFRDRGTEPGAYPKPAIDFLIDRSPPGRLFIEGKYAGYAIWRLSPEKYKVFTDNRYDIWGAQFIADENAVAYAWEGDAANGRPDWRSVVDKWSIRTLFIHVRSPLHLLLSEEKSRGESDWDEIWNDGGFAIWILRP